MKKNCLIISICGKAQVGKDLAFSLIKQSLPHLIVTRYAFADKLKSEMTNFLLDKFDINIWNCSSKEKSLIRELLVQFGLIKRNQTKGRYFIEQIKNNIKCDNFSDVIIITDLRYALYPKDEHFFIKNELGGLILYIDKCNIIKGKSYWSKPANIEEETNIPKLEKMADCAIYWEDCDGNKDKIQEKCLLHIQKFIKFLQNKKYIK